MEILHVSDLHFRKDWFLQILNIRHDVCCISGDLLDTSLGDLQTQKQWVTQWLLEFKKPLFICSGNHDVDTNANAKWLDLPNVYADKAIKSIDGVKFGCVPYMYDDLLEFDECDVLLVHVPPFGTKTAMQNGKDYGDKELARMIKTGALKARVLLCGHIHEPLLHIDTLNQVKIYNSASNGKKELFSQVLNV